MTDKDGKKIKVGSVVAARKIGHENFTVKGTVLAIADDVITFRLYKNEGVSYATSANIKRIRYGSPKD